MDGRSQPYQNEALHLLVVSSLALFASTVLYEQSTNSHDITVQVFYMHILKGTHLLAKLILVVDKIHLLGNLRWDRVFHIVFLHFYFVPFFFAREISSIHEQQSEIHFLWLSKENDLTFEIFLLRSRYESNKIQRSLPHL